MDTDILIVGAGPTGLLLANLLGAMGVRTLVVERNAGTVEEPRTVSIDDESMRALQAAGLAGEVEQITARGYGSIYRGPSGRAFATVKPDSKEYGFDKRNAFQQPELEALMREGLGRFDCVTALFSTEVTGFEQGADNVTATLSEGKAGSARYMVACDGGRSGARKALGIGMSGSTFEEPWLIVDLHSTKNRSFHTEVFCDPARPAITLPGPGGIRRYEFMLFDGEDAATAETEAFARELLAGAGPDRDEPLRRVQVYTFHARIAERWREGRVLLAGDAAHLTPPFAGQGMNSGLRDAHNLAWKLAEALLADSADELLDSYQAERKAHAWSMIRLAEGLGQIMMPTSPLQGTLVRGAFHAISIWPPARDYVAQMRYKPKPSFEAGLIEPDGRKPSQTITGRMIAQPVVELPGRKRMLLDELLPDGLVLLVHAERPEEMLSKGTLLNFAKAGVAVIGLTPEWAKPSAAEIPTARDVSRFFSSPPLARYLDHVLLVRRDRYVAGTRPAERAEELLTFARRLSPRS